MTPTISVPTDNIYKFMCLFGLAIIIASIACYVSIYINTLDKKIYFYEKIKQLEYIENRTKAEEDNLSLYTKLVEVATDNESTSKYLIGTMLGLGLLLSINGFYKWFSITQKRDDKISDLQLEKLELEVYRLQVEKKKLEDSTEQ